MKRKKRIVKITEKQKNYWASLKNKQHPNFTFKGKHHTEKTKNKVKKKLKGRKPYIKKMSSEDL